MGIIAGIRMALGRNAGRRERRRAEPRAQILPEFLSLPWQEGRALSSRTAFADLPQHYRGWVYAAVRAISQGCAACDLRIKVDGMELPRTHPLARLFAEVNPMRTYRELIEMTLTDLELSGNAWWVLSRRAISGVPAEIWPVPPAWMRIVPGAEGVEAYELRRAGRTVRIDPRDCIHFRYPSPGDPYYGTSPLAAALEAVRADESVARAQRRTFDLGPLPGVVLKTQNDLTDAQRERLRSSFDARYSGADNAGRLMIAGPDSDITPFSVRPREMDFLDSARSTRDRILGVFGVPPAVLGLVEDFNRANAEAAHTLFARDTLAPKLKLVAHHTEPLRAVPPGRYRRIVRLARPGRPRGRPQGHGGRRSAGRAHAERGAGRLLSQAAARRRRCAPANEAEQGWT